MLVSDFTQQSIQQFGPDGTFMGIWRAPDLTLGGLYDITIGSDGTIYVVDAAGQRILKLTSDGQFDEPARIVIDRSGYVYVADLKNHRVQVFEPLP